MIHEIFPEYFPADDPTISWKRALLERASGVIAISENTKKDIIKFYDIDSNKVTVIHLANSLSGAVQSGSGIGSRPTKKYLLYVGDRSLYKNFYFFAESIAPLLKANPELRLVCAGKPFSGKESAFFKHRRLGRQGGAIPGQRYCAS